MYMYMYIYSRTYLRNVMQCNISGPWVWGCGGWGGEGGRGEFPFFPRVSVWCLVSVSVSDSDSAEGSRVEGI